jgi:hypothetical protein
MITEDHFEQLGLQWFRDTGWTYASGAYLAQAEEVVHVVTTPTETSLAGNNRAFHRLLMDGVKVEFTNAQLIDFQTEK